MRYITVARARAIDTAAREKFGISTLVLMENAGARVCDEALAMAGAGMVTVVCGKGNNGGDGLVCCRHLLSRGARAEAWLASPVTGLAPEAAVNLRALRRLGAAIFPITTRDLAAFRRRLRGSALVVDALLGTGFRGEPRPVYREAIAAMNTCGRPVLSVDIPSGLDGDTGAAGDCCVRAERTVTFFAPKRGMARGKGPRQCGTIVVAGLGVPLSKVAP